MKRDPSFPGSLLELFLAISVIAAFAALVVHPGSGIVAQKARQTRALATAKQIALACKLFAEDHEGKFPSNLPDSNGRAVASSPSSSNEALALLIPGYIPERKSFWLQDDNYYCNPSPPEGKNTGLGPGENHWAYVTNLTAKSRAEFPLITDPTIPGTTRYSRQRRTAGAAWDGKKVIVIRVDGSGSVEWLNSRTMNVPGPSSDIPDILRSGQSNWLGPENKLLNPIPKLVN